MTHKIGRNDPCPCGSDRKFKQCCLLKENEKITANKGHDGAVERAVDWLMTRHRKAVMTAIDEMLFEELTNEEQDNLESLDA